MNFGIFSYLITILIFTGGAVLIEWGVGCFKKLKKFTKIIGIVVGLSLIGTAIAEPVALRSRGWMYSNDKTFGIYIFGAALETYIFTVFVAVAIASATLIWSDYEKKNIPLVKKTFSEIKSKLQKLF